MNNIRITFSFLFIIILTFGQLKAQNEITPKEQLIMLKEKGVLLVRLHSSRNKINALREKGYEEDATSTEAEQRRVNREIVYAFIEKYDFSEVYFFYDYNSTEILNGNFKEFLLDKNFELALLKKSPEFYLIGDFSQTEKMSISALVIMDKNYEQLESPFPFYQRSTYFLSLLSYSKGEVVEKINLRLNEKYKKYTSN